MPTTVDYDWFASVASEGTAEIAVRVECVYLPIAEITDENIAAESAKGE